MKAMVLEGIKDVNADAGPLSLMDLPRPIPRGDEILIRIRACGVCRTELDEIEGRTSPPRFPIVLGHQVVGIVAGKGEKARRFREGDRVGVGWIFSVCGKCQFCTSGRENLCRLFRATGRDEDGGYAEYMKVHEDYAFPIPDVFTDTEAAPLLCAGAIGYRSIRLSGIKEGQNLGLSGFGASAHLVLMTVRIMFPRVNVFVFARNAREREFAMELGADWAGEPEDESPEKAHCIIDTTPAWKPVVESLANLERGGKLVINAIRKEDEDKAYLLKLDYPAHLWMEKEIRSVANVTRQDIREFLEVAAGMRIRPEIREYPLAEANKALRELKQQKIRGAKVIVM